MDENHILQLAAIMTASIQNTETTIRDRIDKSNPYWTQAYDDVCRAVDREMALRAECDQLKADKVRLAEVLKALCEHESDLTDLLAPAEDLIQRLRRAVMYDAYTLDERCATPAEQLPLVREADKGIARLRAAMGKKP